MLAEYEEWEKLGHKVIEKEEVLGGLRRNGWAGAVMVVRTLTKESDFWWVGSI